MDTMRVFEIHSILVLFLIDYRIYFLHTKSTPLFSFRFFVHK